MDLVVNILFAFIVALCMYFLVPHLIRNLLKQKFLSGMKKSGSVYLTFDDGPNPDSTPEILNLLEELQIKATFFLIGENIEKYPDLYDQLTQQGHEVGDHGYRHIHAWACPPFSAMIDLFRGSLALKRAQHSKKAFWLRPPYGKLNLFTLCYVLLFRRKLAFWNVDPRDYIAQLPEEMSETVLSQLDVGSVVLLHERSFDPLSPLRGNLEAIKMIVQKLQSQGCTFSKLSEVVSPGTEKQEYMNEEYCT